MRKVEILLANREWNPLSWAIRAKLGTNYCHVAVKFYSNIFGCNLIYEANWKGVNLSTEDNWLRSGQNIVASKEIELTKEAFALKIAEMGQYLGAPYGFLNLFEIALGDMDLGKNKGLICSQVGYLWVKELIHIDKPEELITPKDIAKALGIKKT